MGPQSDLRRDMEKFEMPRLAFPNFPIFSINQLHMKEGIIVSCMIIFRPGCELLVGGHERACHVVREEVSLGGDMKQLDHVIVTDESTSACFWKRLRGNDLPVIIGVCMLVSSDLLSYGRISLSCAEQERVYLPLLLIRPSSYTSG